MKTKTLILGDKSWEVSKFVLGEVIEAVPQIMSVIEILGEGKLTKVALDGMADIVLFTINRVEPTFTRENLNALDVSLGELRDGFNLIATQAGMVPQAPGEA